MKPPQGKVKNVLLHSAFRICGWLSWLACATCLRGSAPSIPAGNLQVPPERGMVKGTQSQVNSVSLLSARRWGRHRWASLQQSQSKASGFATDTSVVHKSLGYFKDESVQGVLWIWEWPKASWIISKHLQSNCAKSQLHYLHKEGVVWMNFKAFPAPDTCEYVWLAVWGIVGQLKHPIFFFWKEHWC